MKKPEKEAAAPGALRPMKCPRCKRAEVRLKVNLFLDIPSTLRHGLSKLALRLAAVRVDGADWPKALYYCPRCGWNWRPAQPACTKEHVGDACPKRK